MIYKTILFVAAFTLFFGVNKSNAQCDCIEDITLAVQAVMAEDLIDGVWEAPHALEVHLAKLDNWCDKKVKPLKSKVPNIIEGMLGTISEAYEYDIIVGYDDLGAPITETVIAPQSAVDALDALATLLEACSS